MNFNEYQELAMRTASTARGSLVMAAMGLAGEAGEVVDMIKKVEFQGHPLDRDKLAAEIGDVLWYAAAAADALGMKLGDIADGNIAKLRRRFPGGLLVRGVDEQGRRIMMKTASAEEMVNRLVEASWAFYAGCALEELNWLTDHILVRSKCVPDAGDGYSSDYMEGCRHVLDIVVTAIRERRALFNDIRDRIKALQDKQASGEGSACSPT